MNAYEIWQSLIFFKESFMLIALILNKKMLQDWHIFWLQNKFVFLN